MPPEPALLLNRMPPSEVALAEVIVNAPTVAPSVIVPLLVIKRELARIAPVGFVDVPPVNW